MAWLLRDGDVLASADVAQSFLARNRGLLGQDGISGALVLPHTKGVHSVGMRFSIDVAWLDRDFVVIDTTTLRPYRVAHPRWRARSVVEAEAGAFDRWGLKVGDRLEIKE
ncbi:MAG TPA: DUF192 domain-containing protein [Acidimicrobiales bacterium]|nr:DUF192 domain-containing protein [Acidimicrobiales bacterium]